MTTEEPEKPAKEDRRRGDFFGISALASALLSGLAGDKLSQSLDSGGWIRVTGLSLTILFALIWAIYNAPAGLRRYRRWRSGAPAVPDDLHAAAEEAEQWMVSLGSDAGGLGAVGWFQQQEPVLRKLLVTEKATEDNVDEIARICDALDAWYVRQQQATELLEVSEYLVTVAHACGRRDLEELGEARAATAYRLMGDLKMSSRRLGNSYLLASARRGYNRTRASMRTRRRVEQALVDITQAESRTGSDREESLLDARNRLEDARLTRPGTDFAADVAIQLNLAIVHLHQGNPVSALDQLRPAAAKAAESGDASAQAHALELRGVAAWMQKSSKEAMAWWQDAQLLYAEIGELEGQARCLQHLGSAEVVTKQPKGLEHLKQSAELRGGEDGYATLTMYLELARAADEIPEPPADSSRVTVAAWFRRLLLPRRLR